MGLNVSVHLLKIIEHFCPPENLKKFDDFADTTRRPRMLHGIHKNTPNNVFKEEMLLHQSQQHRLKENME